jgi:hypothetical protein
MTWFSLMKSAHGRKDVVLYAKSFFLTVADSHFTAFRLTNSVTRSPFGVDGGAPMYINSPPIGGDKSSRDDNGIDYWIRRK